MRQTTKAERNALKIFLEKSGPKHKVILVGAYLDIDRGKRALEKLKDLFTEEDYTSLSNLYNHREVVDFTLEVTKIYKRNNIDLVTFRRI